MTPVDEETRETKGKKFIGTAKLCARWDDCSAMTIERKLRDDESFPKPYYITRVRMWDLEEIEAYERKASREPRPENRLRFKSTRRKSKSKDKAA